MANWILNTQTVNGKRMVRYLMKQKRANVAGMTTLESAMGLLKLGKKEVRMSEEFEGYPITADGVYYFDGNIEEPTKEAEDGVEIGADGLPILAGDGVPKKRKKRIKDVACE